MNTIIRQKNFMNTTITFKVVQNKESTVEIMDAIEAGFGEFDRIVKTYTRFDEKSELSNLNRQPDRWINISKEFYYLVEYMLNLAKATDGAFDPTVIDFLEIYGYDKNYDFSKLEKPELDALVEKIAKERPSWKEIELDKENLRVKLVKNQRIDLGGIGKGYAIDCAFNKLNKFENFFIDAGGDIRVKGNNEKGELWTVDLLAMNQKGQKEIVGQIKLDNESIAGSGSWARKFKQFHHLINPKTGKPQNTFSTVFVQAPTSIESDSWATALFIGGEEIVKVMPENFKYFTVKN
jgi:thiamine biosynthesis lipoprotein